MKKIQKYLIIIFTAVLGVCSIRGTVSPLQADDARRGAGFSADMFPTIVSASAGEPGFSFQGWAAFNHIKVRAIGGHMYLPPGLTGSGGFGNQELTVAAVIADYMFGDHFDGFWIGAGAEYWGNTISHEDTGEEFRWNNYVLTLGGGHIWRIYGNLYINPWAAVHYITNPREFDAAGDRFSQRKIQGSFSMKIGYFFDL